MPKINLKINKNKKKTYPAWPWGKSLHFSPVKKKTKINLILIKKENFPPINSHAMIRKEKKIHVNENLIIKKRPLFYFI